MRKRPPTKTSFKKGNSAGIKGRPVSTIRKEKLVRLLEIGDGEFEEVFCSIISHAKAGNMQAARLFIEYMALKPHNELEDDKPKVDIAIVDVMKELHGKVPIEYIDAMINALKTIEEKQLNTVH